MLALRSWPRILTKVKKFSELFGIILNYSGIYGTCSKMACNQQSCLPIGETEIPASSPVRLYCPRCKDLLTTEDSLLDGAFFGPNLPHMFFMVKPTKRPFSRLFTPPAESLRVEEDHRLAYTTVSTSKNRIN